MTESIKKLINTKADVEAACRIEARSPAFDADDYLVYALHHIQAAIAKRDDAPCSSAEHAKAAQVALQLERRPTYRDVVQQWEREALIPAPPGDAGPRRREHKSDGTEPQR